MRRARDCVPPSHDLLQVDQAEKGDVTQCTAHGPWLQTRVSAVCGQALPPCLGAVLERVREWKPLAQDLVQVDQPLNEPGTQSTGHAWLLHARVSVAEAQAVPPHEGCRVMVRVRVCEPLPQLLVQVFHADQPLWPQLTLMFDQLVVWPIIERPVLPGQYAVFTVLAPPHEAPPQERYEAR